MQNKITKLGSNLKNFRNFLIKLLIIINKNIENQIGQFIHTINKLIKNKLKKLEKI